MRKPAKSAQEVVDRLNALPGADQESEHAEADSLLMDALRLVGGHEIADAFNAASDRVGFWYA